ncbi:MAG: hypothetical protein IT378_27560, partial [Sandaracinaceae bacterium]|nr:hypothetical protein [Sandaracinaceae bacterium]
MARAVLVVADDHFIGRMLADRQVPEADRPGWERDGALARFSSTWAGRVDDADGPTYPGAPPPAQGRGSSLPVMTVRVDFALGARGTREAIVAGTLEAVRQAATFAQRGGVVALILGGHGDAQVDTTSTWVDLAPARHLRVTVEAVERA